MSWPREGSGRGIGRRAEPEGEQAPTPSDERRWPPEELLLLHDRYDVSDVQLEGGGFLGRLVAPLRARLLRPLVDLASRQTDVNALTAQALSELANKTTELQASDAERRKQAEEIQALRRRLAALESTAGPEH